MAKHPSTGPGRIRLNSAAPRGGVRAQLVNFDIDVDVPKAEHLAFLNERVVPILAARRSHIWMQGSASSSGSDAHNMALSRRRAENVAAHLRAKGVRDSQITISAVGEGLATTTPAENAEDRTVALLAAPLSPAPQSTPAPVPAPATGTPRATSFRIRMLGGLAGDIGFAIDGLFFQIWDQHHGITAFYMYTAAGIGVGPLPVSVTLEGPWNDFNTTGPLAVDEFGGAARFTTGGGGNHTLNFLNMMSMPRGTATIPNPLALSTGFTVGIGGSTTVGHMERTGSALPFAGP